MAASSQNFEEIRIGAELIWGQRETESLFGTRKFQNFSKAGLLRDISSKTCFFSISWAAFHQLFWLLSGLYNIFAKNRQNCIFFFKLPHTRPRACL